MRPWIYVVVCLALPQAWAALVVRVLRTLAHRRALANRPDAPPGDFTI